MKRHPAVGDVYLESTDGPPGAVYLVLGRDVDHVDTWSCLVLYPSHLWHEDCQDIVYNTDAWLMNSCERMRG
jgi:hypothetical protein